LGNDFIIRRDYAAGGWVHRWIFNPNTQSWSNDDQVTSLYKPKFAVFNDIYAWYTNGSGESPQAKIYKKIPAVLAREPRYRRGTPIIRCRLEMIFMFTRIIPPRELLMEPAADI